MKQLVSNLLGSLREHDISSFASKLDSFLAGKHESKRAGAARTVVRELVSNGLFSEDTAEILSRVFEKYFPSAGACSKHNDDLPTLTDRQRDASSEHRTGRCERTEERSGSACRHGPSIRSNKFCQDVARRIFALVALRIPVS